MSKIYNLGDSGLIDGGIIVIEDYYGFYVYRCNIIYDAEKDYYITSDYIFKDDLESNSWINLDEVKDCCGSDKLDVLPMLANNVIEYYGTQSPEKEFLATEDEALKFMHDILTS